MGTQQPPSTRDIELAETWLEAETCFHPADSLHLGDIARSISTTLGHRRISAVSFRPLRRIVVWAVRLGYST